MATDQTTAVGEFLVTRCGVQFEASDDLARQLLDLVGVTPRAANTQAPAKPTEEGERSDHV